MLEIKWNLFHQSEKNGECNRGYTNFMELSFQ